MAYRRKIWNRTPRNRFEAWIQDMRDRYNIGLLLAFIVLLLAGRWFLNWLAYSDVRQPASFPERSQAARVASAEEYNSHAAKTSSGYFYVVTAIPALGDSVDVTVEPDDQGKQTMGPAQMKAFEHLRESFPRLREKIMDAMLRRYRAIRTMMIEQEKTMSREALSSLRRMGVSAMASHFPDLDNAAELEKKLSAPQTFFLREETDGMGHVIIDFETDFVIEDFGVEICGDEILESQPFETDGDIEGV